MAMKNPPQYSYNDFNQGAHTGYQSSANTVYRQGLVVPAKYGSPGYVEPSMYTNSSIQPLYNSSSSQQLPTTSQSILSDNGVMQGLGQNTIVGNATPNYLQNKYNDIFGTSYGAGPMTANEAAYNTTAAEFDAAQNDINSGMAGGTVNSGGTSNLWGKDGMASGIAQGIGAAANLANAYMGYKNYGLAKDKFAFEKASTNRNVENQAQQYNAELQNRGEIGLALGGASVSPEQRANTLAQMERQKISGAALG